MRSFDKGRSSTTPTHELTYPSWHDAKILSPYGRGRSSGAPCYSRNIAVKTITDCCMIILNRRAVCPFKTHGNTLYTSLLECNHPQGYTTWAIRATDCFTPTRCFHGGSEVSPTDFIAHVSQTESASSTSFVKKVKTTMLSIL